MQSFLKLIEFLFLSKMAQVPMRMAPGGGHGHPHHLPPSHHAIPGHLPFLILYTSHLHIRFEINFSLPPPPSPFLFTVYTSRGAVLWIRDILVPFRIRGSVPLTYGSGFGSGSWSCFFRQWPSRWQQKIFFFSSKFFAYLRKKWWRILRSKNSGVLRIQIYNTARK